MAHQTLIHMPGIVAGATACGKVILGKVKVAIPGQECTCKACIQKWIGKGVK